MNRRTGLLILLSLVALSVVGCQEPQRRPPGVPPFEEQVATIEEVAVRLGLRIAERDEAFYVLKNAANTVLIFTHTDGRFFVNGKPIGAVGTVKKVGSTIYVPDTLVATIRPHLRIGGPEPPVTLPGRKATVVIDPGHGGKDPGTTAGPVHEKHIVLQVATKVAALLERQGVTVVMTREDDRFIELEDRAGLANRRNTDLFVSIHADSAPDRSVSGYTIYIAPDASSQAQKAARSISAAMAKTGSDTRGIRDAEYKVLMWTRCPAVLVELGYLSNSADARRLQDATYQNRLAQAVAEGILNCLP